MAYIELFHESEFAIQGGRGTGPEGKRLAEAIDRRISSGQKVHFNPSGEFNDPPLEVIPKDEEVIIGGNEWLQCVHERARCLRQQGYTNVKEDHSLSYDTFRS